jgi:hypothetical protein
MFLKIKQDRQCTCNVTLRHIHVTIVAVEEQQLLRFVRVFMRFD